MLQVLPAELIEICTMTMMHKFHSPSWFSTLHNRLPLPKEYMQQIGGLETGHALVFSSNCDVCHAMRCTMCAHYALLTATGVESQQRGPLYGGDAGAADD